MRNTQLEYYLAQRDRVGKATSEAFANFFSFMIPLCCGHMLSSWYTVGLIALWMIVLGAIKIWRSL